MRKVPLLCLVLAVLGVAEGLATAPEPVDVAEETLLPGVELAQTLATSTGIAITPLLGVSAVGAWQYFTTPEESRHQLPWFSARLFWVPALLLVAFMLFKEPILGWAPIAGR